MSTDDGADSCPRCGFLRDAFAIECARCGVVFAKLAQSSEAREELPDVYDERPLAEDGRGSSVPRFLGPSGGPRDGWAVETVANGRVGRSELLILGSGLAAAIVVYAVPFTRFVFSALVTLFHELGHAVAGWLLGYPSIPAFDFVYGGGLTHHGEFQLAIAILVGAAFGYGIWLFRENRKSAAMIGAVFLVWLFFVTSEWRRELAFASAGHLFEFLLAAVLFYKALAGVGWKIPEVERPLGAFAAFFVQIHSMAFAWRLIGDRDFLAWYKEGKGGALMNDLEVIALDLRIYTPLSPSIEGIAKALLLFSVIPIAIALAWYFQRARWHRVLQALRTAET